MRHVAGVGVGAGRQRRVGLALATLFKAAVGLTARRDHNPEYPAGNDVVEAEWKRLRAEPRPLARPLIVLGGYRTPTIAAEGVAILLSALTNHDGKGVAAIGFLRETDIEEIARGVVERIDRTWPSRDERETVEVDVVGISMGGLVARTAAQCGGPGAGTKRLKIVRLFTLASPHRGAKLARVATFDHAARCMRPGSAFLDRLNGEFDPATYELVAYARLRDLMVGATNAAPPGTEPIWTPGTLLFSHVTVTADRRILVDIARRLRGEPALALRGSRPPRD